VIVQEVGRNVHFVHFVRESARQTFGGSVNVSEPQWTFSERRSERSRLQKGPLSSALSSVSERSERRGGSLHEGCRAVRDCQSRQSLRPSSPHSSVL
jgi:hypothetical protein